MLVELETDKVSLEVAAPDDGVLAESPPRKARPSSPARCWASVSAAGAAPRPRPRRQGAGRAQPPSPPKAAAARARRRRPRRPRRPQRRRPSRPLAPSVQRIVAENRLDPAAIAGTGKDGRITKGDALAALEARADRPAPAPRRRAAAPARGRTSARSGCG